MRRIAAVLVLLSPIVHAGALDIRDYRQASVLTALINAPNIERLRSAYENRTWPDAAVSMVYAVRLHELGGSDADDRLIDAIPRTPVDFWYAFEVFKQHDTNVEQRPAKAYWHYWKLVPDAVLHRNRGFRDFLLLSAWATSGEMMDQVDAGNERLWEGNRTAVLRVLKSLNRETRDRICNAESLPCSTPKK